MSTNKKHIDFIKRNLVIIIFVFIEAVLYASFLYFDFVDRRVSEYIKYSAILTCLLASLYAMRKKRSICSVFTALALLFTCISDYFLLLSHDINLFYIGIFTFFIAQIFYAFILNKRSESKKLTLDLTLRVSLTVILLIVGISIKLDALTTCALIYFIQLLSNFIMTLVHSKKDKRNLILALALFLFILCDINVALNNLPIESETFQFVVYFMMRLFYLPSQVILSINSYFFE